MENGFYYNLDEKKYEEADGWRRTALAKILQKSLNFYQEQQKNETPSLIFGRAIHCALLEPDEFSKRFIEKKDFGRKKSDLENKEFWLKSVAHMGIVSKDDMEKIKAMQRKLFDHPLVSELLKQSQKEVTAFTDMDGIKRKARFDMMIKEHGVLIDYKTTTDASHAAFRKSISNYLYDFQAADYLSIANNIEGSDIYKSFIFIAQEKEPPFEIGVFRLDDASIEVGEDIRKRAIEKLKRSLSEKHLASYPLEIQDISLPAFGFDVDSRVNN